MSLLMVEGSYDLSATQNNLEVPPIGKLATIANVVTVSIRFDGVAQAIRDILRRNATVFNTFANRITNELNHPHRAAAAFEASAFRSSGVIDSALALPPSTLSFLFSGSSSSISPVAIFATVTAHPTTSPGRLSPFGPRGMASSFRRLGFFTKGGGYHPITSCKGCQTGLGSN